MSAGWLTDAVLACVVCCGCCLSEWLRTYFNGLSAGNTSKNADLLARRNDHTQKISVRADDEVLKYVAVVVGMIG